MGNCSSRNYHVPVKEKSGSEDEFHEKTKRHNHHHRHHHELVKEGTESTVEDRDGDVTLPLSPETALSLSPHSVVHPISSPQQLQQQISTPFGLETPLLERKTIPKRSVIYDLPDSPVPLSSHDTYRRKSSRQHSLHSSPQRRPGRALQKRLDKARHVQMALSGGGSHKSSFESLSSWEHEDNNSRGTTEHSSSLPHPYSVDSRNSSKFSVSGSSTADQLKREFEATANRASIWAELTTNSEVMAVAISQRKPSLSDPSPALYMAVGTADGNVLVVELLDDSTPITSIGMPTRRLGDVRTFSVGGRVRSLHFSPDFQYLAVGGDDCTCTILQMIVKTDEDDCEELAAIRLCCDIPRVDRVYAVRFSPDSRYLAIGGFDGTVAIVPTRGFQTRNPEILTEIPRDGLVLTVDWSPDGRYLAIGGSDKLCGIVGVHSSWNVVREIKRPSSIQCVKWYPYTGKYLAIGSVDVVVIDRDTYSVVHEIPFSGQNNRVNSMCWSPNGSYFVVSDSNHKCTMFEGKTFATIQEMRLAANASALVWGQQTVISGTPRRYLVIGGGDKKVSVVKAGIEINSGASSMGDDMSSAASSSYFSNRGDWVFKEDTFRDVDENIEVMRTEVSKESTVHVVAIAFSRGSKIRPSAYFACATDDGNVTVRSTIDWRIIAEIPFNSPIVTMTFSNGSRYLALGMQNSSVYIVETAPTWTPICKGQVYGPVRSLAFSKNNERLAVGTESGVLHFLNAGNDYTDDFAIDSSDSPVLSLDWCSKYLAVGREDGSVSIFESAPILNNFAAPVAEVDRNNAVRAVAFGASSRFLAVGGGDGMIGIYSAKGGWVLCHQVSGGPLASPIRWCPSGRYIAFTSEDGTDRVIDTIFWSAVEEINESVPFSKSKDKGDLAFSQDGKWLAISRYNGGIAVLNAAKWNIVFVQQDAKEHNGSTKLRSSF